MAYKTSQNVDIYIEEEQAGQIPFSPAPRAQRYVSTSLEGSYQTIENDTLFPGRNPEKSLRGTESNAGDLVVNFAPHEHDDFLKAVLCSVDGFVRNAALSDTLHDVYDMVLGNKQRSFYLEKAFTQDPALYHLFQNLQFSTASISFAISALVKITFGLMGSNNPKFETTPPVDLSNALPPLENEQFFTLQGSAKFQGPDDPQPVEYIDYVSITVDISNNMADLQGLFQLKAIDKTIGMLNITGTISEYVKDGKLYNLAKEGKGGTLYITVYNDEAEYTFILKISFDNSTLSGDQQLQTALPFKTYGADRFILRKSVPRIPVTGVALDQSALSMTVGDYETLTATVSPANATNQNVIWTSDDDGVAAVAGGVVEAVGAGTCTITATTEEGGHTGTCSITVS
ncbi:MAG: Ig-like domain-containing protein [Treponema sp.]|jgi:hypothetical protein|nr:Ig-like domain-containing protein [Treponema sp.]